jgi:hypothetical protein
MESIMTTKEEKLAPEHWGKVVEIDDETKWPIVFNFRPTSFVVVDSAHRKDWEEMVSKYVGMVPDMAHLKSLHPTWHPNETICGCHHPDTWDDCDVWKK